MKMKLCVVTVNINSDVLVKNMLSNCEKYVDRIYVEYPKYTNLQAGKSRPANVNDLNKANPDVLKELPFYDRIVVIQGDVLDSKMYRNVALDYAERDGMDIAIIQDMDEFYFPEDIYKNISKIEKNRIYSHYRTPWYIYWKNTSYVIEYNEVELKRDGVVLFSEKNGIVNFSTCFAVDLKIGARFKHLRVMDDVDNYAVLDGMCHHLSWVLSDDQVKEKVSNWGHNDDVDNNWYKIKWLAWQPKSRCLNYSKSSKAYYSKARKVNHPVPYEALTFNPGSQMKLILSKKEKIKEFLLDTQSVFVFKLKKFKAFLNDNMSN